MTVVDTSLIYALLDANDNNHQSAVDWYTSARPALSTTPLVLAELDHSPEFASARWHRAHSDTT